MATRAAAPKKDIVFCYDSPNGFQVTVGHATFYKAVLIVHSPSGDLNNTLKSDRMSSRYVANPLESELIEVAALNGISADDARERIYRYGPSIRFVCNPSAAEDVACLGVRAMIAGGVKGLSNLLRASREVHAILLMVPEGPGSEDANLAFPSEYIRDQVIRGLATNRNDVVDLLRFINSVYGNMRGEALKSRMLDLLGSAGNKIRFKTKDANGDGVVKALQIAGAGVALRKAGKVLSLPKGGTLQQRVLYRPPYSNNTAWDALIVEDDTTAYLLQMTVSLSHPPIKREGLVAGAKFLTAHGFKGTVHLVFLTTPYVLRWLKLPQSVTETDAVTAEQQWPQHAWCVDKVNDLDYWSGASTLAKKHESI
jgi:hypothetical protein